MRPALVKLAAWSLSAVAVLLTLPLLPFVWMWSVLVRGEEF